MKKTTLFFMMIFTQTIFAGVDFSSMNCKISGAQLQDYQQKFEYNLKFASKINTENNSRLAVNHSNITVEVKYLDRTSNSVKTLTQTGYALSQQTSFHGYEIKSNRAVFGSDYDTVFSVQPKKIGGKVVYTGEIEVNAKINNQDQMIVSARGIGLGLKCELK